MKARRVLYGLIPAALLLLGGELLAREYAPPGPETLGDTAVGDVGVMLMGNPFLGWELSPGQREEVGGVRVSINRDRMRGPQTGPKTVPRVLVSGDSSVYGFGVSDEDVFAARLAAGGVEGAEIEVINAGVPGYSTVQSLNLLALRGLALEPDLLLVLNLWSDSNFDTFVDAELLLSSDGERLRYLLGSQSGLLGWLEYAGLRYRRGRTLPRVTWMTSATPVGTRRVPIDDYAANLARFCTIMAGRGGGVMFAILPSSEDNATTLTSPPWEPYREVMRQTATACQAPLVDLREAFSASGLSEKELFLDEVHPSARGHALIAEQVRAALAAAGWPGNVLKASATPARVSVADPVASEGARLYGGGIGTKGLAFGSPPTDPNLGPPKAPAPPGPPGVGGPPPGDGAMPPGAPPPPATPGALPPQDGSLTNEGPPPPGAPLPPTDNLHPPPPPGGPPPGDAGMPPAPGTPQPAGAPPSG